MTDQNAEKEAVESPKDELVVSHYWMSTFPFFEATLFVVPPRDQEASVGIGRAKIELFDPDGFRINEVETSFPLGKTGVVELGPLLGSCKFESGIKHAHVIVTSPQGTAHHCRLHTREKAALLGEPTEISEDQPGFFPLLVSEDRSSFVAFVNYDSEDVEVRCRLICGKRSPEVEVLVPAMGARLISIEDEFVEQSTLPEGHRMQAYVRLMVRTKGRLGALLLEQTQILNDRDFFASVC